MKGKERLWSLRAALFVSGVQDFVSACAGHWPDMPAQQPLPSLAEHDPPCIPAQHCLAVFSPLGQQDAGFESLPSQQETFAAFASLPWQQAMAS
jgi:hypothetical protein